MDYFLSILLVINFVIISILVITLNLLYKDIIKEFYDIIRKEDVNGNFK